MKKTLTKALLVCLLVLTMVLASGCTQEPKATDPSVTKWKVTFYDSDGTTVLGEAEVEDGNRHAARADQGRLSGAGVLRHPRPDDAL